jgi:hypothetical protein
LDDFGCSLLVCHVFWKSTTVAFAELLSTVGHMPRRLDPIVRLEMGCNPRSFSLKRTAKSELMCKREGSIRVKERFKNTLVLGKRMQGAQMGTELNRIDHLCSVRPHPPPLPSAGRLLLATQEQQTNTPWHGNDGVMG